MRELALFAGAGGGILAGQLLGWRLVCAVESDHYCQSILLSRQNDGTLPPFPLWSDVRDFDGQPWRGRVDIVSGGFPCQDISKAGSGRGLDGARSGLWSEFARVVREVRPRYVFLENSPALTSRGLGRILADLAADGFAVVWCLLGAQALGAPHERKRLWLLADAHGQRHAPPQILRSSPQHAGPGGGGHPQGNLRGTPWWALEPGLGGVAHGLPLGLDLHGAAASGSLERVAGTVRHRVSRIKGLGNAQVPSCAAAAFLKLKAILDDCA